MASIPSLRRGHRPVVIAVLSSVVFSLLLLGAPAEADSTYIKVSNGEPVVGQSVTISGGLSTHVKRHAKVQHWTGKQWAKTGSAFYTRTDGTFAFKKTATAAGATYRVYAYAETIKKKRYDVKTTGAVRVKGHPEPQPPVFQDPPTGTTAPKGGTPSTDACGTVTKKADGTPWECTFSDDFTGTTLNQGKWIAQQTATSGYHSGPECFMDSPENISVRGGQLDLTVRKTAKPFTCKSPYGDYESSYTSGSVSTWDRFSQAYGRFTIRAKFPASKATGLHSALWLYPQKLTYGAWPSSGEIDIAEYYTKYPDRAIPYIHYNSKPDDGSVTAWYCMLDKPEEFHNYTADWTSSGITISYDNKVCMVHKWNPQAPLKDAQPFDQPFIAVLTQALGVGGNAFDPNSTPLPATMSVDWIRVWK